MVILMLKSRRGSPDGSTVLDYAEGSKHDLSATPREKELAELFVRDGWAQELREGISEIASPAPPKAEMPTAPSSPAAEVAPAEPPSPPPAPAPAPAAKGKQRR